MDLAPCFETKRLTISPVTWRDLLFFFRLLGNAQTRRYLGGPVPWSSRYTRFKSCKQPPPGTACWVMRTKRPRRPIGLIILGPHKDRPETELSYQCLPSSWGQGYVSEGLRAVIAAHHVQCGAQLIAETQSANTRSCQLLDALGWSPIAHLHRFGAEQVLYRSPASSRS